VSHRRKGRGFVGVKGHASLVIQSRRRGGGPEGGGAERADKPHKRSTGIFALLYVEGGCILKERF